MVKNRFKPRSFHYIDDACSTVQMSQASEIIYPSVLVNLDLVFMLEVLLDSADLFIWACIIIRILKF